ncbi:MAG: radical SAM protein, partial [Methanobacterium paludis]|nr:radical SAM protein [Methanobacterium paludis]
MSKLFPTLKIGYALHKGPEYGFVYPFTIGKKNKGYLINEDAARIIDKCNGKKSLEDIANELAIPYQEDPKSTLKIIESYLKSSKSFIDISNEQKCINFQTTGNWEIPTPTHVSIELTNKCNFSCKHCYINSGPKNEQFWDIDKLFTILEDLKSLGVLIVELTGGEPFVHPKFMSIAEFCIKQFPL